MGHSAVVPRTRKVVFFIVLAFVVYAVLRSPETSADVFRDALSSLGDGLAAIGRFFDALLTG